MNYFISGIGTNVGKTIAAAVLTEALKADYWKPIQSGTDEGRDAETVKKLISNTVTVIHPEAYLLKAPLSPHFAAKLDGVEINLQNIQLPETSETLIIEGAGGLLVPLNDKDYVIDLAKQFKCDVVLIISNYLGCINHTLLSLDYLKTHGYKIAALVFNGRFEPEVKDAILNYSPGIKHLTIPEIKELNRQSVQKVADGLDLEGFF